MQGNHDGMCFGRHYGGAGGGGVFEARGHLMNSNYNVRNLNFHAFVQSPTSFPSHLNPNPNLPNPPTGNPNFPLQQQLRDLRFPPRQIPGFLSQQRDDNHKRPEKRKKVLETSVWKPKSEEVLERIENAAKETRRALIDAGKSVSSVKVSMSVLSSLKVDSWGSLGFEMQEIPSLRRLMELEGKINAFIHCFVGVRKITTLYDLEGAICESEGVDRFDDLELGPLLRHPLVSLYFSSCSGANDVFKITSQEIISLLDGFVDGHEKEDVEVDEFLDYIAKKRSVASKEKLGICIQNLGVYVSFIRVAKRQESKLLENFRSELQQKYHRHHNVSVSQHVDSSSFVHKDFCGKHIRFDSSSSDDEDGDDSANKGKETKKESTKPDNSFGSSKKKRKAENISLPAYVPSKCPRRYGVKEDMPKPESGGDTKESSDFVGVDVSLSDNSLRVFISTWKDACKELTVAEVLERMLQFYKSTGHKEPSRRKRMKLFSSFPVVGLLNVAIASMRCGMWDNTFDNGKSRTGFGNGHSNGSMTRSATMEHRGAREEEIVDDSKGLGEQVLIKIEVNPSKFSLLCDGPEPGLSEYRERDRLLAGNAATTQVKQTGRLGEEIAFRYFADIYPGGVVKWVNECYETGLPYDIVIEDREDKRKQYVEVKATICAGKEWFNLSVSEWEFAYEKGDSFIIAHVLLGNKDAVLTQHRNPVKLCRERKLQLLLSTPKQ